MDSNVLQDKVGKEQIQKRQDRLISFFDAIVAVGITMIVMGIALPEGDMGAWELVLYIGSEVTVYLVSFIALAELWRVHHAIFSYFEGVADENVINVHIALMFLVTIFPFLTRFMNAYQTVAQIRVLYVASYVAMNLLMVLIVYLANKKHVQNQLEEEDKVKKWIPLMLSQGKGGGLSADRMKEFEIYSAMFKNGVTPGTEREREGSFALDEGMRQTLKAMGLWEEEDPSAKRVKTVQAIISISLNFISVTLSVILLMVNPLLCYIVFVAKFVLDLVLRQIVELISSGGMWESAVEKERDGQALTTKNWADLWKEGQRNREREQKRVAERMRKDREDARKQRRRMREEQEKETVRGEEHGKGEGHGGK